MLGGFKGGYLSCLYPPLTQKFRFSKNFLIMLPALLYGGYKVATMKGQKPSIYSPDLSDAQVDAESRFSGTDYEQMVKSNPYENYNYTRSLWDKIGNHFGFRTKEDQYAEDMALASRQYISQIDSLKREEDYNSENSKIARMRAAGLNPDLQGLDAASVASEFAEPENSPASPAPEDGEHFKNLLSSVQDIGSFILSLETGIASLNGVKLANDARQIENGIQLFNLATGSYDNLVTPLLDQSSSQETDNPSAVKLDPSKITSGRGAAIASMIFGGDNKRSRRLASNFESIFNSYGNSLQGLTTRALMQGEFNDAQTDIAPNGPMSSEFLSSYKGLVVGLQMNDLSKQAKLAEVEAKFAAKIAENGKYEKSLDASLNADIAGDELSKIQAENAQIFEGAYDPIADAKATNAESLAREKEAELAQVQADAAKEDLRLINEWISSYMESHPRKNGRLPYKVRRILQQRTGYMNPNDSFVPMTSFNGNASAGLNVSRRTSSSVVKRIPIK